jgi:hypothetical protein
MFEHVQKPENTQRSFNKTHGIPSKKTRQFDSRTYKADLTGSTAIRKNPTSNFTTINNLQKKLTDIQQKKPTKNINTPNKSDGDNSPISPSSQQQKAVQRKKVDDIIQDKPKGMSRNTYLKPSDSKESAKMEARAKFACYKKGQVKQLKRNKLGTRQLNGENINDDKGLEKEADVMGAKANNNSYTTDNNKTIYAPSLQLKSDILAIQGKVTQLTSVESVSNKKRLKDNKGRVKDFTGMSIVVNGFNEKGEPMVLKVMYKSNNRHWFKHYPENGVEPEWDKTGADLPDFWFRKHDAPKYFPVWDYGKSSATNTSLEYGKAKVKAFMTPNGPEAVDVKISSRNKIIVERLFRVGAKIDESQMTEGYHVEYRQYIKGFFNFGGEDNPHQLYDSKQLERDTFHEDGNRSASPYGRRGSNGGGTYDTSDKANIIYKAEDIPGFILNKNETGQLSLTFNGAMVVVKDGDDKPIDVLVEREWSFGGKVKNLGGERWQIL